AASYKTSNSTTFPPSRTPANNNTPRGPTATARGATMTVLFDGIASGLLLFLISVGLSVTLGLMNFVNLAHGAFAMLGGYVCVVLLNRYGVPFLATLPIAMIVSPVAGIVLERTLYRRLYGAPHLDQVLFSIGLVFMSISTANYFFG